MRILFTLLSIDAGNKMYIESAKRLVSELLEKTNHDIVVSSNNASHFKVFENERFKVRNNIDKNSVLQYKTEFNYNLKYHCFDDLVGEYDCVIYLDCDIKIGHWSIDSENIIKKSLKNYDFLADRFECVLSDQINEYQNGGRPLFSHKIRSYDILKRFNSLDDIMNSKLPSEHFLIFRYDKTRLDKFKDKWSELNTYLQNKNGDGGSWGDGFEIGISARHAGYHKTLTYNQNIWEHKLGFIFNGNKY